MLLSARDSVPVVKSSESGFATITRNKPDNAASGLPTSEIEMDEIPAVKTVNNRSECFAFLGAVPWRWRPLVQSLPFLGYGDQWAKAFGNMAVAAIARRLAEIHAQTKDNTEENGRSEDDLHDGDMLEKLLMGRDDQGKPLRPEELSSEAVTFLGAGSDTTAK